MKRFEIKPTGGKVVKVKDAKYGYKEFTLSNGAEE